MNDKVKLFGVGFTTGAGPAATGSVDVTGRVVSTGTGYLELEATTAWTGVLNAAVTNGKRVVLIGTAYAEGARTGSGGIVFPVRNHELYADLQDSVRDDENCAERAAEV